MTIEQHKPGWFVVSWSLNHTLLIFGLVRFDTVISRHAASASIGRTNARYHFMKPARVLLSRIRFRNEMLQTEVNRLDEHFNRYRILLKEPEASIEVLAENTAWIEW